MQVRDAGPQGPQFGKVVQRTVLGENDAAGEDDLQDDVPARQVMSRSACCLDFLPLWDQQADRRTPAARGSRQRFSMSSRTWTASGGRGGGRKGRGR